MLWMYVHSKGLCPSMEDLPGVYGNDLHVGLYIAKMCLSNLVWALPWSRD